MPPGLVFLLVCSNSPYFCILNLRKLYCTISPLGFLLYYIFDEQLALNISHPNFVTFFHILCLFYITIFPWDHEGTSPRPPPHLPAIVFWSFVSQGWRDGSAWAVQVWWCEVDPRTDNPTQLFSDFRMHPPQSDTKVLHLQISYLSLNIISYDSFFLKEKYH